MATDDEARTHIASVEALENAFRNGYSAGRAAAVRALREWADGAALNRSDVADALRMVAADLEAGPIPHVDDRR